MVVPLAGGEFGQIRCLGLKRDLQIKSQIAFDGDESVCLYLDHRARHFQG